MNIKTEIEQVRAISATLAGIVAATGLQRDALIRARTLLRAMEQAQAEADNTAAIVADVAAQIEQATGGRGAPPRSPSDKGVAATRKN